jgi:AcrR family transcriptional regulator
MIDAMSELCAEQGYEATKIADVVRRAHVARKTLYDNFSGKEELFLAAFDLTLAEAEAVVAAACEGIDEKDWEARTEAGMRALLEFVAGHPAEAKLCLVEAPAAGPESAARYEAALEGAVRHQEARHARGGAGRRHGLDRPARGPAGRHRQGARPAPRAHAVPYFSVPRCRKKVTEKWVRM